MEAMKKGSDGKPPYYRDEGGHIKFGIPSPLTIPDKIDTCPFCGGETKLFIHHVDAMDMNGSWDAWPTGFFPQCTKCNAKGAWYYKEADAIAAWNRREGKREEAALRGLLEAAKYVLDTWQIDTENERVIVDFGPAQMLQARFAAYGTIQNTPVSQPGDPCENCKSTNHCPVQNPCPIKQVWLEGNDKRRTP